MLESLYLLRSLSFEIAIGMVPMQDSIRSVRAHQGKG